MSSKSYDALTGMQNQYLQPPLWQLAVFKISINQVHQMVFWANGHIHLTSGGSQEGHGAV
jgi:hypothetical protein